MSAKLQANPPGPTGYSLLGDWQTFRRDPLNLMHRWQGDYGDLMRFRLGHRSFYQLSHPELAEKLLIE